MEVHVLTMSFEHPDEWMHAQPSDCVVSAWAGVEMCFSAAAPLWKEVGMATPPSISTNLHTD